MMRALRHVGSWSLLALTVACAHSPVEPTGLGQTITITYQSIVPASMPWPSDTCGTAAADARPVVLLNWSGAQVSMESGMLDHAAWRTDVLVPTNIRLDISVRDPGLCRMSYPPYGEFAWSGVAVNGTMLQAAGVTSVGTAPCFTFRVLGDGEIALDRYR